jgi:hypothetical protein
MEHLVVTLRGTGPSRALVFTLQTGATMNGRALAQTQVALQQATITQPSQ